MPVVNELQSATSFGVYFKNLASASLDLSMVLEYLLRTDQLSRLASGASPRAFASSSVPFSIAFLTILQKSPHEPRLTAIILRKAGLTPDVFYFLGFKNDFTP